jgi:hypothetical protein
MCSANNINKLPVCWCYVYSGDYDVLWCYKLSLVGIKVTPDEGPSLETSTFSLYFSGSCIHTNESLFN